MLKNEIKKIVGTTASKDRWQKLGVSPRSGILVALFSVYSRESIGVGDFDDLRLVIDFCRQTGNSILQLLPLNETGSTFCPYDATSSFALEPMYVSLRGFVSKEGGTYAERIESLRRQFPVTSSHVDYRIRDEKIRLAREIFLIQYPSCRKDLAAFLEQNSYWLPDFSLFKVLKEHHHGKPWYEWKDQYKKRDQAALKEFEASHEKEILFQMWIQWQLFLQLKAAKEYAASQEVLFKGDLPILVSRDSADVWAHPEFFKLEYASGAPPDMYCAKGQRWGMPPYNWSVLASDGYMYHKEKLTYAQNFYDLLRIDHVVGFFRIWSIPFADPEENAGLNGVFDPREEHLWGPQGKVLLMMLLGHTRMLLCGEDLGTIPKVCPETMGACGIPGNDVQRWVKDWEKKHDFLSPEEYRVLSVAMLSTHDTTNWPAWWEHEAGTIDEALFRRKCAERGLDYTRIQGELFDAARCRYGRLRWAEAVDSVAKLVVILGKKEEEVKDFIELYQNSYHEKEKLWKLLGIKGLMREAYDAQVVRAVLEITLSSRAVFCINTLMDWLYLLDIFPGDPYPYRLNTPGTVSDKNWSLRMPIALDELVLHKACVQIKKMVKAAGRI
jgi:4-alpha-glucanotransferase